VKSVSGRALRVAKIYATVENAARDMDARPTSLYSRKFYISFDAGESGLLVKRRPVDRECHLISLKV
jgi:hypothetical protein